MMDRKSFIQRALNAWIAIGSLPFIYALIRYVAPPPIAVAGPAAVSAGQRSSLSPGAVKLVSTGATPFFVREDDQGGIESFSAKCSHMGCVVEYVEADRRFRCNCHGSLFDEHGVNLTGPATAPLRPYRVELRGDDVVVTLN
jgi:cytochrome b6-f complex iron-sulfur subunit